MVTTILSLQVASVVEQAHSRFGRVTGVANCVGNMVLKPAHLTSLEEFRSSLDMNLVSAFNVIKGSVRHMMKSGGGSIALCSAAVALRGVRCLLLIRDMHVLTTNTPPVLAQGRNIGPTGIPSSCISSSRFRLYLFPV